MATTYWRGDAVKTAQVNTITPSVLGSNSQTWSVTINGKSVSYVADASTTVAEVTAGIVAAINATTIPEFKEVTAADNTTTITLTAIEAGKPFTQTSSVTGGVATFTTSTTTANSGPNDASIAANWNRNGAASLPQAGDDVIVEVAVDILYGLTAIATVALNTVTIPSKFTAKIGLPQHNGSYLEYRQRYWQLQFDAAPQTCIIGDGPGQGSPFIRIDTQSFGVTAIIKNMSTSPAEQNTECFRWIGTGTNVLEVLRGSVGVAMEAGQVATLGTLHVGYVSNPGGDATVKCGSGTTLTTINKAGGDLTINSGATTIQQDAGTMTVNSGSVTTMTVYGGTMNYESGLTGALTVGTLNVTQGKFSRHDLRAATVTTLNLYKGGTIDDPFGRITWTNPINLVQCRVTDVTLDVGQDRTLAVAG